MERLAERRKCALVRHLERRKGARPSASPRHLRGAYARGLPACGPRGRSRCRCGLLLLGRATLERIAGSHAGGVERAARIILLHTKLNGALVHNRAEASRGEVHDARASGVVSLFLRIGSRGR